MAQGEWKRGILDVVNLDLLVVSRVRLFIRVLVVGEIEVAFAFIARTVRVGLVNPSALGKLAVLLGHHGLVRLMRPFPPGDR